VQFRGNSPQNGIEIITDFGIREADHAQAEAFEDFGSPGVVVGKPFVLLAV
jgi:hypothetical protein